MKKLAIALFALALMTACSSEPSKPAESEKPKPPEPITARVAFQKCYVAARNWGRDAQPFRLESELIGDSKGREGKSLVWRAGLASAVQHSTRAYTWANGEVTFGVEDTYSPTNTSTTVFDIAFLKVDSNQALETAMKHGGDKILEKAPDTPILYVVDWNRQSNELLWHVIFGTDRNSAKLVVAIDASSGEFLREEK
ncbi:MAG TPA: hypothetical protein VNW47_07225 [Terriglobales bacterium]|jgi:hypothetical protein|nr:hypothetical protein [Terriglobales bacterium]